MVAARGGKPNWQFLTCENEWLGKRQRGKNNSANLPRFAMTERTQNEGFFFTAQFFFAKRSKRQNPQFANLLRRVAVPTNPTPFPFLVRES